MSLLIVELVHSFDGSSKRAHSIKGSLSLTQIFASQLRKNFFYAGNAI